MEIAQFALCDAVGLTAALETRLQTWPTLWSWATCRCIALFLEIHGQIQEIVSTAKTAALSTGGVEDLVSFTPELTELLNICIAERCTVLLAFKLDYYTCQHL